MLVISLWFGVVFLVATLAGVAMLWHTGGRLERHSMSTFIVWIAIVVSLVGAVVSLGLYATGAS